MVERKREIYIKLENVKQIVDLLNEIKGQGEDLRRLFAQYDQLNLDESKIFENWSTYYEDISQKLDHVTL